MSLEVDCTRIHFWSQFGVHSCEFVLVSWVAHERQTTLQISKWKKRSPFCVSESQELES